MKKLRNISYLLIFILFVNFFSARVYASNLYNPTIEKEQGFIDKQAINDLVMQIMETAEVPGVSISIVNDEQSIYMNYGYADIENKLITESDTYYELGSMSKAFTALGIFLLEEEGLLSLDDLISDYLPWFQVYYKGEHKDRYFDNKVELTLRNLLYHTSGIPYKTIGQMPVGTSDDMLENTVKKLNKIKLDFYPGEYFQYTSFNYDILGLIIQVVTKISYEEFIKEEILIPLGLNYTFLFREEAQKNGLMASGYKISFFKARIYEAPNYRGNTPAGYIISNIYDMERWIRIQMGQIEVPEYLQRAIQRTHIADNSIQRQGDDKYAGGWSIHRNGMIIQHGGSNPNYSSMIIIYPEKKIGLCILMNLNSSASNYLANNIMNIIEGNEITRYIDDSYQRYDMILSYLFILFLLNLFIIIIFYFILFIEVKQKKRNFMKLRKEKKIIISVVILLLFILGILIYNIPTIVLQGLSWNAVCVWASPMIMVGCFTGYINFFTLTVYLIFKLSYPKTCGVKRLGL